MKVKAARHALPSLLYVPDVLSWWDLVDEIARVVFTSLIKGLDNSVHVLVLTTAKCDRHDLPPEILELFNEHQKEIFETGSPNESEREQYFYEVFLRTNSNADNTSDKSYNAAAAAASARTLSAPALVNGRSNSKRKNVNASAESPPTKRQRISAASGSPLNASYSAERLLTETQVQDLLCRAVTLTEAWPCHQLENLRAALEWTMDVQKSDAYASLVLCLTNFENEMRCRYQRIQPSS